MGGGFDEIHTSAVELVIKAPEVNVRAIDGRVKWYQAAELLGISDACGAFIRLIPQINPKCAWSVRRVFSSNQSG